MNAPGLTFAFELDIKVGSPLELGEDPFGRHRYIPILGGTFAGPLLQGAILEGGGDRQTIGLDGLTQVQAVYRLRAEDGAVIGIDNSGVRCGPPEVIARLARGEAVDSSLYYFRTAPVFDVRPGPHAWLQRHLFIGQGIREPDRVLLRVFRVD